MSIDKELSTKLRSKFDGASRKYGVRSNSSGYKAPSLPAWRDKPKEVSRPKTTACVTSKVESPEYTGDIVKGISLFHKSCYQPVVSQQECLDAASMRR